MNNFQSILNLHFTKVVWYIKIYNYEPKQIQCRLLLLQMFLNVIFILDILSTFMTMILILCDYPCWKEVSDTVHSGKVPDSANGSSQNNANSFLICCDALGRPAWNSHSEEQCWHPILEWFIKWPLSQSSSSTTLPHRLNWKVRKLDGVGPFENRPSTD